ncbi:MAG: protein-disulfide reductase DsbD domain-containing protein [Pseudomonadota bacterium]
MKFFAALAMSLIASFAVPHAGAAQYLTPVDQMEPASLRLTDGWRAEADSRIVALVFELQPGWKTYWRAPGEMGIPPHFDWSGSENLQAADPIWPVPEVHDALGARYPAFSDRLVLPVRLRVADPSAPIRIRMTAAFGVCDDVCIPANAFVEMDLDAAATPGHEAALIEAALASQPVDAGTGGLSTIACSLRSEGHVLELTAQMQFARPVAAEIVMVEAPIEDLWIADADIVQAGATITATTQLDYFGDGPLVLDRALLRLTVIGEGQAVEIHGCPAP